MNILDRYSDHLTITLPWGAVAIVNMNHPTIEAALFAIRCWDREDANEIADFIEGADAVLTSATRKGAFLELCFQSESFLELTMEPGHAPTS